VNNSTDVEKDAVNFPTGDPECTQLRGSIRRGGTAEAAFSAIVLLFRHNAPPTLTEKKEPGTRGPRHTGRSQSRPSCLNVPPMLIWIVYFAQDETHLPFSARMQREYHFRISSFACVLVRQDPCSAQRPGSGRVCQRTTTWGASADACGAMRHKRRGEGAGFTDT